MIDIKGLGNTCLSSSFSVNNAISVCSFNILVSKVIALDALQIQTCFFGIILFPMCWYEYCLRKKPIKSERFIAKVHQFYINY